MHERLLLPDVYPPSKVGRILALGEPFTHLTAGAFLGQYKNRSTTGVASPGSIGVNRYEQVGFTLHGDADASPKTHVVVPLTGKFSPHSAIAVNEFYQALRYRKNNFLFPRALAPHRSWVLTAVAGVDDHEVVRFPSCRRRHSGLTCLPVSPEQIDYQPMAVGLTRRQHETVEANRHNQIQDNALNARTGLAESDTLQQRPVLL